MSNEREQTEGKSEGKNGWIFGILGVLAVVATVNACQKEVLSESVGRGADKMWQNCLAQGHSRKTCDCASSKVRTRAAAISVSEAKNMSQDDWKALGEDALRTCGVSF